jgi:hypothetical protein
MDIYFRKPAESDRRLPDKCCFKGSHECSGRERFLDEVATVRPQIPCSTHAAAVLCCLDQRTGLD